MIKSDIKSVDYKIDLINIYLIEASLIIFYYARGQFALSGHSQVP